MSVMVVLLVTLAILANAVVCFVMLHGLHGTPAESHPEVDAEHEASIYVSRRQRDVRAVKREVRRRAMRARRDLYDELFWDE